MPEKNRFPAVLVPGGSGSSLPTNARNATAAENHIATSTECTTPTVLVSGRQKTKLKLSTTSVTVPCGGVGVESDSDTKPGHLVPVAFQGKASASQSMNPGCVSPALDVSKAGGGCVAFSSRARGDDGRGYGREEQLFKDGIVGPIDTVKPHCVAGPIMQVRRLTPTECLRLQGFPDNWLTGLELSDSAKYRMCGNAVAVPCAEWIARRLIGGAA